MKLLFATARFPYPPFKGDQAIPYYRLKHMGKHHDITLLTFYESDDQLKHLDKIKPFCKEIITIKKSKIKSLLSMLTRGLFTRTPLQVLYYDSREFKKQLDRLLTEHDFDVLHTYMLRIADSGKDAEIPRVLELIDSMQLNFKRRTDAEKPPLKWLFNMELNRLKHYENKMVELYDAAIVVSDNDREYIQHPHVHTIPLGIDTETFFPKKQKETGLEGKAKHAGTDEASNNAGTAEPVIVFTGNMGYFPNRNAVLWFLEQCWPHVKEVIPTVKLVIAGKDPGAAIQRYHDGESVQVLGFVDSMADVINSARVAIAPMQAGSGMQFKILEAMACGKPVVATTMGLGTIPAIDGESILLADEPAAFAAQCVRLLQDDELVESIGTNGLEMVARDFSWGRNVERVGRLYDGVRE